MTETEWQECTYPGRLLSWLASRGGAAAGRPRDSWAARLRNFFGRPAPWEPVGNLPNARKLRLFVCGLGRAIGDRVPDDCLRHALELGERLADGTADDGEQAAACAVIRESLREDTAVFRIVGNIALAAVSPLATSPDPGRMPAPVPLSFLERALDVLRIDLANVAIGRKAFPSNTARKDALWTAEVEVAVLQCNLLRDVFGNPFRPASVDASWGLWNGGTVPRLARGIYEERCFEELPVLADALEESGCTDAALLAHLRGPGPHVRGCHALDLLLGNE